MDVTLASVIWQLAIVHIDDVIIFSRTPQQHLEHTKEVLRLMKEASMTIKLKKCPFFCESIAYLGHVIAPGKLQVARKTTEATAARLYPTTVYQMRSFLGL